MKYIIFMLLLVCTLSCKGTKDVKNNVSMEEEVRSYKEIATEKLGEGEIQFLMNDSESLVLCRKSTVPKYIPMGRADSKITTTVSGNPTNIKLIVVDMENGEVLYEKSIAYGSAEWESNSQLKIVEIMGANSSNNPNMYLYDVLTKSITQINNEKVERKK